MKRLILLIALIGYIACKNNPEKNNSTILNSPGPSENETESHLIFDSKEREYFDSLSTDSVYTFQLKSILRDTIPFNFRNYNYIIKRWESNKFADRDMNMIREEFGKFTSSFESFYEQIPISDKKFDSIPQVNDVNKKYLFDFLKYKSDFYEFSSSFAPKIIPMLNYKLKDMNGRIIEEMRHSKANEVGAFCQCVNDICTIYYPTKSELSPFSLAFLRFHEYGHIIFKDHNKKRVTEKEEHLADCYGAYFLKKSFSDGNLLVAYTIGWFETAKIKGKRNRYPSSLQRAEYLIDGNACNISELDIQ